MNRELGMSKINLLKISLLLASAFNTLHAEDSYKKNLNLMKEVVNQSIHQLIHRYDMHHFGRGGREKDGKTAMEFVAFNVYRKLNKEEARILLVEIVELLLKDINSSPQITSYLYDNPFTYKNLEIKIFVCDSDGSSLFYPNLCVISLNEDGLVSFKSNDPNKKFGYASDEREAYEEAYKIATQR